MKLERVGVKIEVRVGRGSVCLSVGVIRFLLSKMGKIDSKSGIHI